MDRACADCGTEGQHRRGGGYCLERQLAAAKAATAERTAEVEKYLAAYESCVEDLVRAGAVVDEQRLDIAHTEALLEDREREIARLRRRAEYARHTEFCARLEGCPCDCGYSLVAEGKDPKEGA